MFSGTTTFSYDANGNRRVEESPSWRRTDT